MRPQAGAGLSGYFRKRKAGGERNACEPACGSRAKKPRPSAEDRSDDEVGDEVCSVCSSARRAASMLLCDGLGCAVAAHFDCLSPPLAGVPRGDWFCADCDPYADSGVRRKPAWMQSPSAKQPQPVRAGKQAGGARAPTADGGGPAAAPAPSLDTAERQRAIKRLRAAARELHYSSTSERLLCRTSERDVMLRFVRERVEQGAGGALYVCGTPGNGKTVTVNRVCATLAQEMRARSARAAPVVVLNAFAYVDSPADLFVALAERLRAADADAGLHPAPADRPSTRGGGGGASGAAAQHRGAEAGLEARFAPPAGAGGRRRGAPEPAALAIVFVDEIDSLHAVAPDTLYRLFEWSALPGSRLALVGIANAIDLTERMLPALARRGCTPEMLTFSPYRPEDIMAILEERLLRAPRSPAGKAAGLAAPRAPAGAPVGTGAAAETDPDASGAVGRLVERSALEFCARKVCAASSDARKALDICRGALELVLKEIAADGTPGAAAGATAAGAAPAPQAVTVRVMARAVSATFKSRIVEVCASLPQHQQLFMCAAVLHFRARHAAAHAEQPGAAPPLRPIANGGRAKAARGVGGRRAEGGAGETTVGQLYRAYVRLCAQQHVRAISASEVVPACQALAACGLLHMSAPPGARALDRELEWRVSVAVPEEDLKHAVREVRFFREILDGGGAAPS